MFCEKCGSQVADGSKFCMSCGARVEQKKAEQEVAAGVESAAAFQPAKTQADQSMPQPVQADQSMPQTAESQQIYHSTPQTTENQHVLQSSLQPAQQTRVQSAQPVQEPVLQNVPSRPANNNIPQHPAVPKTVKEKKPVVTTPLPVWKYIGILILSGIPILGIVMLFVWSFSGSYNLNTRNYARAVLICILLFIIISLVGLFGLGGYDFLGDIIDFVP